MDWRERTYYWVMLNCNGRRPNLTYKDWDSGGVNYERRVRELRQIPGLRMHPLPSMALDREKREKVPAWAQMLVSCRRAHLYMLMNTFIRFGAESYGNFRWEPVKEETGVERRQMEAGRKLKVGDTVRILDGSKVRDYAGGWTRRMDDFVGRTLDVDSVAKNPNTGTTQVKLRWGGGYTWDARYLELVEGAKAAEPAVETETETVAEKWNKEFKIRNSAGVLTVKAERELSLRDVFLGMGDDKLPEMKRPRLELHKREHYNGWLVTLSDRDCEGAMYVLEFSDFGDGVKAYLGGYDVEVPDESYVTMEEWKKE